MKLKALAVAVAAATISSGALAVDFNGYFRSGLGVTVGGEGGDQNCAVSKNKVGRLGNECDTYAEFGFAQELQAKDGVKWKLNSMIAAATDQTDGWESTNVDEKGEASSQAAEFALAQFNVEVSGLLGGSETIWAGKRYYQRHDVHITDQYYWNISGPGIGIENIDAGPGRVSFAWVKTSRQSAGDTVPGVEDLDYLDVNVVDLRYAGLDLWKNGSLELGIDYAITNGTETQDDAGAPDKNGVLATAELVQGGFLGGFNKLVLQYGTEGYSKVMAFQGDGSWYGAEARDGATGWRFIDHGVISPSANFDLGYSLGYAVGEDMWMEDHKVETANIVLRPVYKYSETGKLIAELGWARTSFDDNDEDQAKYTIAHAWSMGKGFWARPEIRVYATYYDLDEADSVTTFGAQVEGWW